MKAFSHFCGYPKVTDFLLPMCSTMQCTVLWRADLSKVEMTSSTGEEWIDTHSALKWKLAMEGIDDQCTKSASFISVTFPAKCPDRSMGRNHPQSFTYSVPLPMASSSGFWHCYTLPGLLEAPLKSGLKLLWSHNFFVLHLSTAHILWTTLNSDTKEVGRGISGLWVHRWLNSSRNLLVQSRYPRSLSCKWFLSNELVFIPFSSWLVEFVTFHMGPPTYFLPSWWQPYPSIPQWAVLSPSPEHSIRVLGESHGYSMWPLPPIVGTTGLKDAQVLPCIGSSMVHLFFLVLRTLYFLRFKVGSHDLNQSSIFQCFTALLRESSRWIRVLFCHFNRTL